MQLSGIDLVGNLALSLATLQSDTMKCLHRTMGYSVKASQSPKQLKHFESNARIAAGTHLATSSSVILTFHKSRGPEQRRQKNPVLAHVILDKVATEGISNIDLPYGNACTTDRRLNKSKTQILHNWSNPSLSFCSKAKPAWIFGPRARGSKHPDRICTGALGDLMSVISPE